MENFIEVESSVGSAAVDVGSSVSTQPPSGADRNDTNQVIILGSETEQSSGARMKTCLGFIKVSTDVGTLFFLVEQGAKLAPEVATSICLLNFTQDLFKIVHEYRYSDNS